MIAGPCWNVHLFE